MKVIYEANEDGKEAHIVIEAGGLTERIDLAPNEVRLGEYNPTLMPLALTVLSGVIAKIAHAHYSRMTSMTGSDPGETIQ